MVLYSSLGESLINPFFHPGYKTSVATVDYIRPKYSVSDMTFWEDGDIDSVATVLFDNLKWYTCYIRNQF